MYCTGVKPNVKKVKGQGLLDPYIQTQNICAIVVSRFLFVAMELIISGKIDLNLAM